MNKKLLLFNSVLVLAIIWLLVTTSNLWLNPPYPAHVDIASLAGSAKKFETPPPLRENYPPTTQESVIKQNLFRKEREEYIPPPPPPASEKPPVPPPNLKVSGLMLFTPQKKIAVLEGTYSVMSEASAIENKTLKKKGYNLGEQIGSYHITDINKTTVVLDNKQGSLVSVSLATRSPDDRIQRNGNHFFHKSKVPRPAGTPVPETPVPVHVSGARLPGPGEPGHVMSEIERISGAKTPPQPVPQQIISGVSTGGPQGTVTPFAPQTAPAPQGTATPSHVSGTSTGAQGVISGAPTSGSRVSGG